LTLNLEQIKKVDTTIQSASKKDLSIDTKSNASFCSAYKSKNNEFSQNSIPRSNTESYDTTRALKNTIIQATAQTPQINQQAKIIKKSARIVYKPGSAKVLNRTKTVIKPEELLIEKKNLNINPLSQENNQNININNNNNKDLDLEFIRDLDFNGGFDKTNGIFKKYMRKYRK